MVGKNFSQGRGQGRQVKQQENGSVGFLRVNGLRVNGD